MWQRRRLAGGPCETEDQPLMSERAQRRRYRSVSVMTFHGTAAQSSGYSTASSHSCAPVQHADPEKREQAASAHLDIRLGVPELVHHERHARARTRLARRKRAHMRGEPGEERTHGSRRRARRMRGDEPGRPRRRDLSDLPPRHGAR